MAKRLKSSAMGASFPVILTSFSSLPPALATPLFWSTVFTSYVAYESSTPLIHSVFHHWAGMLTTLPWILKACKIKLGLLSKTLKDNHHLPQYTFPFLLSVDHSYFEKKKSPFTSCLRTSPDCCFYSICPPSSPSVKQSLSSSSPVPVSPPGSSQLIVSLLIPVITAYFIGTSD